MAMLRSNRHGRECCTQADDEQGEYRLDAFSLSPPQQMILSYKGKNGDQERVLLRFV